MLKTKEHVFEKEESSLSYNFPDLFRDMSPAPCANERRWRMSPQSLHNWYILAPVLTEDFAAEKRDFQNIFQKKLPKF